MKVRHALLKIDVLLEDLEFDYWFSDEQYRIDRLKVTYAATEAGVLEVVDVMGGGRKILKDGASLHKVYTRDTRLWEWALVPREIRELADAAALAEATRVRDA